MTRALRSPALVATLAAGVLIAAWIEAGFATFTWPAALTTAGVAVAVVGTGTRRRLAATGTRRRLAATGTRRRLAARTGSPHDPCPEPPVRPKRTSWRVPGAAVWGASFAALLSWELVELFQLPRSAHPTMSSLAEPFIGTAHHAPRAAAFVVWAALGWWLARSG